MAEHDRWPTRGIRVHSANDPGLRRILVDIDYYRPYQPGYGTERVAPWEHSHDSGPGVEGVNAARDTPAATERGCP